MKLARCKEISTIVRFPALGSVLLSLILSQACQVWDGGDPPWVPQTDITPEKIFENYSKPLLTISCQSCHGVSHGAGMSFLVPGMEYQSITTYSGGKFINVPMSSQSLLVQKGVHEGPALTPDEYLLIRSWLDAEIITRPMPGTGMRSALLPTVPIAPGDYNMNLGNIDPINDPQANLTFHLAPDSSGLYRISNLTLTAGPTTGIHIQHPRLYYISNWASYAAPSDDLAAVDEVVPPNANIAIGNGTVMLSNPPSNDPDTQIGIAFMLVEKAMPTNVVVLCKDYADFSQLVTNYLQPFCATSCHGGDYQNATNAFNMTAAGARDMPTLATFCTQALGRITPEMPNRSILLRELIPVANGGTQNHPFKLTVSADITGLTTAVTRWAAGEQ